MATIKEWKHTNGYEVGETLPSVSSDDNGKVLGVSDGAWGVIEQSGGGGGSEPLIVGVTDNGSQYVLDKTFSEIVDAFMAGTPIIVNSLSVEEFAGLVTSIQYSVYEEEYSNMRIGVASASAGNGYVGYSADDYDGYPYYQYD